MFFFFLCSLFLSFFFFYSGIISKTADDVWSANSL
jgi:hypothetical protein